MLIRNKRTLIAGVLTLGIGALTAWPGSLAGAAATGTASMPGPAASWPGCRYVSHGSLRPSALCFRGNATANPNTGGTLVGVSADSPSDAWAVGNYSTPAVPYGAFLAHWNGTGWTKSPSPDPGAADGTSLLGVSAVSRTDAWAVGSYTVTGHSDLPLILRWNGTRWHQVPSPVPAGGADLYAVSAISPCDAWAVGIYDSGKVKPFIVHWNGTRWTQLPAPSPGIGAILNAVSVRSATDAWAVGYYAVGAAGRLRSLALHWNGTSWTRVFSPNPPTATGDVGLLGVSTISPDDAWATGYAASGENASSLLLRWNGARWARVAIPNPPPTPAGYHEATVLSAVSAASPADVMVTGWYVLIDKAFDTYFTAFTLRWNGQSWTRLPSPLPNANVQLYGTSVVSANDSWTVGEATGETSGGTQTLSLRWNGTHWVEEPSPY